MSGMDFNVSQKLRYPGKKDIDARPHWIVLLPPDAGAGSDEFGWMETLRARRKRVVGDARTDRNPVTLDLPNETASRVAFACIEPSLSAFELLTLARRLVEVHTRQRATRIAVAVPGCGSDQRERLIEAIVAAAAAAAVPMPSYRQDRDAQVRLRGIEIFGFRTAHAFRRTLAEAEGNALARYLSTLPSNRLEPGDYLKRVRALARENKWRLDFYDIAALKRRKAGAFLAVAQGSPRPDAGMVRLRYTPTAGGRKPKLTLVGKGICYDTGGVSLKPPNYMFGMHGDMQGSAVAVGTLLAIAELGLPIAVDCWLGITENRTGPRAYKSQDVVTAANGKTIQTIHTDAEGRMVLADTLTLANREGPRLIVDYATLTGAVINAVTTRYSGVFTNRAEWHPRLKRNGRASGERVWPFPIGAEFLEDLASDNADIQQCSVKSIGDHILAASFLAEFVGNETPWVHVDLAAGNHKGGLAHIPTEITGFGVRYTLGLLLDDDILQAA